MDIESQPATNATAHARKKKHVAALVIVVLLGFGAVGGLYAVKRSRVTNLSQSNARIASQISSLKADLKKQDDINNGVVTISSAQASQAGVVSMVNGAISLTLPKGWLQTPANGCSGGATVDNEVLCYDVANIMTPDKKFTAGVSVYQYKTSDGTARQWVENEYDEPLSEYVMPYATVVYDTTVNGNSAFAYTVTAPSETSKTPDYVNATYVVVHGTYAVVVNAQVEVESLYGDEAYDYRQNYQPLLQQFIQSVRFKD